MSGILLETLIDHNIQDRIFGLTTDNASDNKTLVDSIERNCFETIKKPVQAELNNMRKTGGSDDIDLRR
jgi:hypothetical protein